MTVNAAVTRPSTTRSPGRPAQTPQELEAANLHRIADVAVAILVCLRQPGRGRYDSERILRGFLSADGVQFSSADVGPALSLIASLGLLVRPEAGLGAPRPGWLPTAADKPAEVSPELRLGRLVISVARGGNGRDNRASKAEIAERLHAADEDVSDVDLTRILGRLVDCAQLVTVRQSDAAPIFYVSSGGWPYDECDVLEADIVATLRDRTEIGFEDESQLREWLTAARIDGFDDRQFGHALAHLHHVGRLQSPRPTHWEGKGPRPTWLVEAVPHRG